tara:strand:+ start:10925 stop:11698 length:774 start_codon:yes stop_codon:yes gene_type:complete
MVCFLNRGNTCYFNSLIQILIHLDYSHYELNTITSPAFKNWLLILNKLRHQKHNRVVDPQLLFDFLKWYDYFPKGKPHDVHEALLKLIEIFKVKFFEFQFLEVLTATSSPYEPNFINTPFSALEITASSHKLEDCLDEYFKIEVIPDWKDENNIIRERLKLCAIQILPSVLVILIKQFYHKKNNLIYPYKLDLAKYCANKTATIYCLKTIVIHQHSHYFTYCNENGHWIKYNDCQCEVVRKYRLITEPPYMLVYQRE